MNVGKINNILFRGNVDTPQNKASKNENTNNTINSFNNITPDFSVKVPIKYTKTGVEKLENGLEVHKYKMSNGYTVTIVPMENSPAVVKTYVNVGSMNETQNIKGISHFLEHMAFNGTNGSNGHIKLETGDSFKKIDELGGWANASTNYAITDYVNSTPQMDEKDIETQIQVLAAMTEDLKLSDEMINKEKGPVCSEINMIMDDPHTIAMDQTVRTLFQIKNPADELVGGSVKHIKNLTRKDVENYYNKYYTPNNINIVITGDVNPKEVIQTVAKNFTSTKISAGKKFEERLNPIQKTVRKDFITDKTKSAEIVLGFTGTQNNDVKEKVLFDAALNALQSNASGINQKLKQYNANWYIDSEKISNNPNSNKIAYFGITSDDKYCEDVLNTIFKTLSNHKIFTEDDLKIIKDNMLIERENSFEYSDSVNDAIGKAVLDNNLEYITEYNKILDSITANELNSAIDKYFNLNKCAITVIHPKKNETAFKGKTSPVDKNKTEEIRLPNNFDVGFYKTKSKNTEFMLNMTYDIPYTKNPAAPRILDEIYKMGTSKESEDDFKTSLENKNLYISSNISGDGLSLNLSGSGANRITGINKAMELLYNPAISEDNLNKAVEIIRNDYANRQDDAHSLYQNFDAKNNPYKFTDEEILNALDSITADDIKEYHSYILNNSRGIITANIPENNPDTKQAVINAVSELKNVLPNEYKPLQIYRENSSPNVLMKANNNSQADICQVYKFKFDDTLKNEAVLNVTNAILSSSSIGLFDNLREKQHLAYVVRSFGSSSDDEGAIYLTILTTTDNKDTGEISYDNVQKSVNGFRKQTEELIAGKFTDSDLENAKKYFKARLLDNESTYSKICNINDSISTKYGIYRDNNIFNEIDNITREDIINFAKNAFKGYPTTSIVASQDTLDANKDFFDSLKNSNN